MRTKRRVNIGLTAGISVCIILLGIFVFPSSYLRLFESLRDLGLSIKYFFCELFMLEHKTTATVAEYSKIFFWETSHPAVNVEEYTGQAVNYFDLFFSTDNFRSWAVSLAIWLSNVSKLAVVLLPFVLVIILTVKMMYEKPNTAHNKDTLPLKVFKAIAKTVYHPVKNFIVRYIAFLRDNAWVYKLWIAALVCHLNIASIIVEFFAFYFYFAIAYDFGNIFVQLSKLVLDLRVTFKYIPKVATLIVVSAFIFHSGRKSIAQSILRHYEARNCGFINELPIVSMSCGSMGKKKTTLITDMALSQEVMFRQKALQILQRADMKFPHFPWIKLENEIKLCMEHKTVYNLASVKAFISKKRLRYAKHGNSDLQLYGYDVGRYGKSFNNALSIQGLFDILETYAQAYFIYVVQSSLIVSNYSIRTDNEMLEAGNLPLWHVDFFPDSIHRGRHSHILDFDTLRLGKKVIEYNPNIGSFEFGVVAITEVGKERGNNLELKEVKKGTDETNQKNDLFNSWLKMCRHSATVDNFPFIKVFTDEQRPESWGADARDLCEIIHIVSSGEQKLTLPFYTIEEMVTEWCFTRFIRLYMNFRYRRGDNTLLVHLLKSVTALLWRRNLRIYNRYGYSVLKIEKELGTMNGKPEKKKYYIMNRKIYAKRFSTDCFSDYFNDMATKTNVGLNDYMEYATEKATVEELKMQNSYFINALYKNNKPS